jgi:hypothetical protein
MFITSAPRRLPASSKLAWVRVELSKNRLIWVSPWIQRCVIVGEIQYFGDIEGRELFDAEKVAMGEHEYPLREILRLIGANAGPGKRAWRRASGTLGSVGP